MLNSKALKDIANEVQLFPEFEQKEQFLFILGALFSRLVSLQKASEIMEMEPEMLANLLEVIGLRFSYLSEEDVVLEKTW